MNRFALLHLLLVCFSFSAASQEFFINYEAVGESIFADSVIVENLSNGNRIIMSGDKILHLNVASGTKLIGGTNIDVFPNPSDGLCRFEFESDYNTNTDIEIYDITGKLFHKERFNLTKGLHLFDLQGLGFGIFHLKIISGSYFYSAKIISTASTKTHTQIIHYSSQAESEKEYSEYRMLKNSVQMNYTYGDLILFTAISEMNYRTIKTLILTEADYLNSNEISLSFNFVECIDFEGNIYAVVKMDTQFWMAENLNTEYYKNGQNIPQVTQPDIWRTLETGAYCNYNNDESKSVNYGRLYNWHAVNDSRSICPEGWRVPNDSEWVRLENLTGIIEDEFYLSGWRGIAEGCYLRESGNMFWENQTGSLINRSGFSGRPGGMRSFTGDYYYLNQYAVWWTGSESYSITAWLRGLGHESCKIFRQQGRKVMGFSVRCIKDDFEAETPLVSTINISNITGNSALVIGSILNDGGAEIIERGIVWNKSINPGFVANEGRIAAGSGTGEFSVEISSLQPGTEYYVRAYAINIAGVSFGENINFTTEVVPPILSSIEIFDISNDGAFSGGIIESDGGDTITNKGVVWSTESNPDIINHNHTDEGGGTDQFISEISGLYPDNIYYLKSYAINSAGIAYGNELSFSTSKGVPVIVNNNITDITSFSVSLESNLIFTGGYEILSRGAVISKNENPDILNNEGITYDGTETGEIISTFSSLQSNTQYFIRAYASNQEGTAYSPQLEFFTDYGIPELITHEASLITSTTAEGGGTIISDGGLTVFAKGMLWNTDGNPDISNYEGICFDTDENDEFFCSMTDLLPSSEYFARAWAQNDEGVGYGNEISFNTLVPSLEVITLEPYDITAWSAVGGGEVIFDGGLEIIARGVVWSTTDMPEINNCLGYTEDGEGIGQFISIISPLNHSNNYYLRAYAINVSDTAYGEQFSFSTVEIPTVHDYDGNEYIIIDVGGKLWTDRNLLVTHLNDGTPILTDLDNTEWQNTNIAAYSVYPHTDIEGIDNQEQMIEAYGFLYNHFTVSSRKLCMPGWHVPEDYELNNIIDEFGGSSIAGGALKSTRTQPDEHPRWNFPNEGASNESEFSVLPSGIRNSDGSYSDIGQSAILWSSGQVGGINQTGIRLLASSSSVEFINTGSADGYSVRCIWGEGLPKISRVEIISTTIIDRVNISAEIYTDGEDIENPLIERGIVIAEFPVPDLDNYGFIYQEESTSIGLFSAYFEGLAPETEYYARAYALNGNGVAYGPEISFRTYTVKDTENNIYDFVLVNGQYWMAENLRTKHFNDGSAIGIAANDSDWTNIPNAYFSTYPNDAIVNINNDNEMIEAYGLLYNWHSVNSGKLCPAGWYIPDIQEYTGLVLATGGWNNAGLALKSTATEPDNHPRWDFPNENVTNSSGFSALPAGAKNVEANYHEIGTKSYFWTGESINSELAGMINMSNISSDVVLANSPKTAGLSIRCVYGEGLPYTKKPLRPRLIHSAVRLSSEVSSDGADPDFPLIRRGIVISTNPYPDIDNHEYIQIEETNQTGFFTMYFTDMDTSEVFYARAFAENGKGIKYSSQIEFKTFTILDIDNNLYDFVRIDNKYWLAKNLRVSRFSDGTEISQEWPVIESEEQEIEDKDPLFIEHIVPELGGFYNGYAIKNPLLCPPGWRIPNSEDWGEIINLTGSNGVDMLKSDYMWIEGSEGTNDLGFNALPAGVFYTNIDFGGGNFENKGATKTNFAVQLFEEFAGWHGGYVEEEEDEDVFLMIGIEAFNSEYLTAYAPPTIGLSVRCVWTEGLPYISKPEIKTIEVFDSINLTAFVMFDDEDPLAEIISRGFVISQNTEPSLDEYDDIFVELISEPGLYTHTFLELNIDTEYFVRAFTENINGLIYSDEISFHTYSLYDIQNNRYRIIEAGEDWWMAQNLSVTAFNTGCEMIFFNPNDNHHEEVKGISFYTSNPVPGINASQFGYVYSHSTINDYFRNPCPQGWRIPLLNDWQNLFDYVGGSSVAGGNLKSISYGGDGHWADPNSGASDLIGFSAQPAGYQGSSGYFYGLPSGEEADAFFWSSTIVSPYSNKAVSFTHNSTEAHINNYGSENGSQDALSIRCIKHRGDPVVKTIPVRDITENSAVTGGTVSCEFYNVVSETGVVWSTSPEPDINNNEGKLNVSRISETFICSINGLEANTIYFVRSFVTTDSDTYYGDQFEFKTMYSRITDIDDIEYLTVLIGDQHWMAENLRTEKYNNGDELDFFYSPLNWSSTSVGAFSSIYEWHIDGLDYTEEIAIYYGYLYNWFAIDDHRGLCPQGWRIPSMNDWTNLITYLDPDAQGNNNIAGGKMKMIRTYPEFPGAWGAPNIGANNKSGFSAVPAGHRNSNGDFYGYNRYAYFACSNSSSQNETYSYIANFDSEALNLIELNYGTGFSVRCIADSTASNDVVIITKPVSDITPASAISGGNVISEGLSPVTEKGIVWSTINLPDYFTNEGITNDGEGIGDYISEMTGLSEGVQYFVRSYAKNSEDIYYGPQLEFNAAWNDGQPCSEYPNIQDIDENLYPTVRIGTQCWMAENLRTMNLNTGTIIENESNPADWMAATFPAYSWLDDDINNSDDFGAYYNWFAAVHPNLCPQGWKVPTVQDWEELQNYLILNYHAYFWDIGTMLKSCRQLDYVFGGICDTEEHPRWNAHPEIIGSNDYNLSVLPCGIRNAVNGLFSDL